MANSNGWGDGAANNSIGWGQGAANNSIGWGSSHATSWASATDIVGLTTDADAQAFITAAAITDPTQQTAINTLVKGMKADGTWTKMKAIYPFVGGTASTHKWNLKDPRDLDAAFRLVFNGGWTHSSNGATPNGTNGYADTKLVPSSVLAQNSSHLSYYSRTASAASVAGEIGSVKTTVTHSYFHTHLRYTGDIYYMLLASNTSPIVSNNTSQGFFNGSRTNSTSIAHFRNGVNLGNALSPSVALNSLNVFLGALNIDGTAANFSTKQTAFSSIGDGLTDTEAANLYTRVQAFQTSLSRQV